MARSIAVVVWAWWRAANLVFGRERWLGSGAVVSDGTRCKEAGRSFRVQKLGEFELKKWVLFLMNKQRKS
jgi:hypothetical protein